ncbi:DUF3566 domain-containing protein [Cryobacterium sp. MDB2-33-2]|uniref:DUF3566 domain-containing protein n=1 Tax=Cryobacterium sp. MDB2-33-2 TaxID=1259179 RepID=UPI00106C239D|nr:DUF3566 domain-containing protein [Cryobacterium sp. MDB2-33-2]TFC03356.1 DUF3566 domain-containing protein [Cryobacterium sp. MDB2-33-2]
MSLAEKLARKSSDGPAGKQVRLKFVDMNVWSVAKVSLLLGLTLGVVTTLCTLILWLVLNQAGAFDQLDALLAGTFSGSTTGSSVKTSLGLGPVLIFSIALSVVGAIAGSALGAIVAVFYNLSAKPTGGLVIGFINR